MVESPLPVLLARTATRYPRSAAVVDATVRLTWPELADRVSRVAGGLAGSGLRQGDTVGVLADNSAAVLEMYFAAPMAGLVLVPLNTRLAGTELAECLADADCRTVVVGAAYLDVVHDAAPDVRIIATGERQPGVACYDDLLAGAPSRPVPRSADEPCYLYYTSGTTGRPKGVLLSARNVLSGAIAKALAVPLSPATRWLHAGPMFHLADAWAIWAVSWLGGCHVLQRYEPERTLRTLAAERITHTLLVPTALERLARAASGTDAALPHLCGLLHGGAPMPATCWQAVTDRFDVPLIGTYGATETAGTITVLPWADHIAPADGGAGRVGRETCLTEVAIVGSDGAPVPQGTVGELVVDSPAVMLGYRNRPDETSAALAGGRYRTGDLGVREGDGVIRLVGRSKDMVISGGENVFPAEVESVLSLHPGVRGIAVLGMPDPNWGEAVVAVIEPNDGYDLDVVALREFGRTRLAAYKLPKKVYLVDALPVTGTGKIDKALLRTTFEGGTA